MARKIVMNPPIPKKPTTTPILNKPIQTKPTTTPILNKPIQTKPQTPILNRPMPTQPSAPPAVVLNPPLTPSSGPTTSTPAPDLGWGTSESKTMGGPQADFIKSLVDKFFGKHSKAQPMNLDSVAGLQAQMKNNPSSVRQFDITPRFEMGVHENAFIAGGKLYVQKTATTFPPTNSWFDCGRAPAALPG